MDIMRWGYYTRFRVNDTETMKAKWIRCQPGAKPPPFSHAFGSSRALYVPEMDPENVGEIYKRHVPGAGFNVSPFAGDHVCGGVDYWQNGWAPGTPPLPVDDNGRPLCCGDETVPVESVGLSLPSEFVVTGSPVFGTGILAGVWQNQDNNLTFMSPAGPPAGRPRFRRIQPPDMGDNSPGPTLFFRGDNTWAAVPAGAVVVEGTNVTVVESPAGTFTVSVPSYPATDITGDLPASQVGSGYPAADVGAGTFATGVELPADQVSAGTLGAGVDLPASQVTAGTLGAGVDLPASQVTAGTLGAGVILPPGQLGSGTIAAGVSVPFGQVTAGYPASSLGSGTLPATVSVPFGQVTAGYPASSLGSGTLPAGVSVPAAQVGSGYPYADLSGAPAAGATNVLATRNYTTVAGGLVTAYTIADSNGLHGSLYIKNANSVGGATIKYQLVGTDAFGNTHTGTATLVGANNVSNAIYGFDQFFDASGNIAGCIVSIAVMLADQSGAGGSHITLKISTVGNATVTP